MTLDDFTMVIPTHRCPVMLANLLELYLGQGVGFRIVVADSSTPDVQARNARAIALYPQWVRHARFDSDCDPFDKFHAVADLVETEYGMYAADDDAVILSGLIAALDFLRAAPDYVACHGIYYNARTHDPTTMKVDVEYAVATHDLPDAFGRVMSLCVRYQALFYAVMRREVLARTRVPPTIRSAHFYELYNSFRILIEGNVRGLGVPYMVRNAEQGDISPGTLDRDPAVWLAKDSEHFWGRGYLPFRAALAAALEPHAGGRAPGPLVDAAYATFLARMFNLDLMFAALGDSGALSAQSLGALHHFRSLGNAAQLPTREVAGVVGHLVQRGWPAYA